MRSTLRSASGRGEQVHDMQKVLLRPGAAAGSASPAGAAGSASSGSSSSSTTPTAAAATANRGPRKLLSEWSLELSADEVAPLLSESNDFTVVGVIGAQGVGKSTVMAMLAGARWSPSAASTDDAVLLHDPPFAPQSEDAILSAAHQTCGVDLFVTPDRLLLLDTQPLISPSILLKLAEREGALPNDVQSYENLHELHSLRLAMFIMSVCHVVICVHGVEVDVANFRMLRLAQTLRHRIPDLSVLALASPAAVAAATTAAADPIGSIDDHASLSLAGVEYHPRLAFLFNRMGDTTFEPRRRQALRTMVTKLFAQRHERFDVCIDADAGGSGSGNGGLHPNLTAPPIVLTIPDGEDESACHLNASHFGFYAEAEHARDELLALRRVPFAKPLSERDWLRGAQRMWEIIRRSGNVSDYNKSMQKVRARWAERARLPDLAATPHGLVCIACCGYAVAAHTCLFPRCCPPSITTISQSYDATRSSHAET